MIINYVLLTCGTYSLYYSIKVYRIRRKENELCSYILTLGIFCFLWCAGYALMGLTTNLAMAPTYRRIALFGVSSFLGVESLMFAYKASLSIKVRRIMAVVYAFIVAGDVLIWGADDVRTFYRIDNRTLYVNGESNGYFYQPILTVVVILLLIVLFVKWRQNTIFARDIRFQKLMIATNAFIIIGSIPDNLLPTLGMRSFPTSPFGGFAAMMAMISICRDYLKYDVSKEILIEHAYHHEKVGFLTFNMDGRLINCNEYAKEELLIEAISMQRLSDLFDLKGAYDNDIIARTKEEGSSDGYYSGKHNNKSYLVSLMLAKDKEGDPLGLVCAFYDRSEEEELLERIRESSETKTSFLANMSHEIRTPINAILGMNEMILRESVAEDVLGYSQNVEKSGARLLNIINDILDYSKIQSDMMYLIPSDYDLSELVNGLIIEYRQQAFKKQIEFNAKVDPSIPVFLNGDEVRIRQIIKNLLDNAIKYTDSGKIDFEISKQDISEEEIRLIVTITDTGRGISDDEKERLFWAFTRADHKENQTISGTGLGLAIAGSFVKMMNGEISAQSEYGEGSEFSVSIPQAIVNYQQYGDLEKSLAEYEDIHENGWNVEYEAPAARILIVDDNVVNLNVAKYLLKRIKVAVDTVDSGRKALELIRKNAYQVIFLDHIMPDMDGIETLKAIREERICEVTPIVALTANDVAGAREMYLDYGFCDFLPKPVSGGSLEKKVYDWLPKDFIHELGKENAVEHPEKNDLKIQFNKYEKDDLMDRLIEESGSYVDKVDSELTHIIILNPSVTSNEEIENIRRFLEGSIGLRYFIFTTTGRGRESEIVKKVQIYFPYDRLRIYCVGGSGTLRNVINAIDDFDRIEIACCPMGTTNDFMKTFGTEQVIFKELKNLVNGEAVPVDYIKTSSGIALNTVSLGLDSRLTHMLRISKGLNVFGKTLPYLVSFVYTIFMSDVDEYEISVDDEQLEGAYSQIIFGNGNVFGGKFVFTNESGVTDGIGSVFLGGNHRGLSMLPTIYALLKGNKDKLSKVADLRQAKKFTIKKRDGGHLALNFDGEMVYGYEKCEAEIVEKGLNFVLPKGVSLNA